MGEDFVCFPLPDNADYVIFSVLRDLRFSQILTYTLFVVITFLNILIKCIYQTIEIYAIYEFHKFPFL